MNSKLPQEMIKAFIDHLHDDQPSLKACSLVCKNWTHPARLHLFSTLTAKWPLQSAVFPFVRHLNFHMYMHFSDKVQSRDEIIPLLIGFYRIVSLNIVLFWQTPNIVNA